MGACDNAGDLSALSLLQPSNARQIAADCATRSCSQFEGNQAPFTTCVDACVEQAVTGLSLECAECYGDLAWCSGVLCNGRCATNACTPTCLTCAGYDTCVAALDQCAGRMSLDCPDT